MASPASGPELPRAGVTHDSEQGERAPGQHELFDLMPQLGWLADADGRAYFFNRRWYEYTGATPQQMHGRGWQSVVDPKLLPEVLERWGASLASGEPFAMNIPLRRRDGAFLWFVTRATPLRDDAGTVQRWLGIHTEIHDQLTRDAAEKRAAEEQRHEADTRFHALVDAIGDYAIFMLDATGHVVTWNLGAKRIKGYDRGEILGQHFSVFYAPEDRAAGKPEKVLETVRRDGRFEEESWRVRKDGTRFWANVVVTALRSARGEVVGFAKVTRDLTERRAAQEALARRSAELQDANRELEAFSYSVSHDLRSPLRGIAGFARALRESASGKLDDEERHYLARIEAAAARMARLIDDLLGLSRIARAPVARADVDASAIVAAIRAVLEERDTGRHVRWHVQPDVHVRADGGLLRIALENLVGNAWKFSRQNADATIAFGVEARSGQRVYFVRDNGAGFDMRHAKNLFAPFQRLHRPDEFEGSGIGLAIVQRIVRRHGGRVWADSAPGEGTTFFFTLGEDVQADDGAGK